MTIQIKKAVREHVYLKLGVTGPAGSGKTQGGIGLAKGLAPTGKVAVIDTENRSASYYAGMFDFDVVELDAPFTTQKYLEALNEIIKAGYEVVVIDSLTHEWAASGGILDAKAAKDARGGNSFANWGEMKSLHNKFVESLLQSHIHVVCTLRSKMEYVLEQDEKGKATPRKVGMAPISSDGMEYEFGVVFDVERATHLAVASKDRTGLFEGRSFHLNEDIGRELRTWLESGAEMTTREEPPAPAAQTQAAPPPAAAKVQPSPAAPAKVQPQTQARPTVPAQTAATQQVQPTKEADQPWVDAMVELAQVTMGMPEPTRRAMVAAWEADGPAALPALLAEIASLRSIMNPEAKAPTTPGGTIAQLPQAAKGQVSQQASDFVDSLEGPDTDEQNGGISAEQYEALGMLIDVYKLNRDALRAYCARAGHLLPATGGRPTLARMKASYFGQLRTKLQNSKIASNNETWSARTIRLINETPTTTYSPIPAAS